MKGSESTLFSERSESRAALLFLDSICVLFLPFAPPDANINCKYSSNVPQRHGLNLASAVWAGRISKVELQSKSRSATCSMHGTGSAARIGKAS